MSFLNLWAILALIPLYLIYKQQIQHSDSRSIKLLFFSLVFMILAIARPALQNSLQEQKFSSQDFIIALDASYSMQADDLKPTRYIASKKAIQKLLSMHPKDRFTLFIFTSNALLISPPTTDTSLSMIALNSIHPEYILTKSTNITKLFKTVSKLPIGVKKLIIFSDGGDEHNLQEIHKIAKNSNIKPFLVATATQKGAALKKDAHFIKDAHASLVISKINPSFKELANITDGKYYELHSLDIIDTLSADLKEDSKTETNIKVKTYKELFYVPLTIALVLFFLAVTKFGTLFGILPLLMIFPADSNAFILDFYHLNKAEGFTQTKHYKKAIAEYKHVTPSISSYYNIATLYYKIGENKDALRYYTKIQTTDPKLKQAILYNMGNCAARIKKYERAKQFYRQALSFGEDKDALYNLTLIKKLHPKKVKDVLSMMPKEQSSKEAKNHQKISKEEKNFNNSSARSGSNQQSQESSHGSGSQKKKKHQTLQHSQTKNKNSNYKLGYKAYEIINKGYSNEKEPW